MYKKSTEVCNESKFSDQRGDYLKEPRKYCNTYRKSTKVGNESKFTLDEQDNYLKEPRKYCNTYRKSTEVGNERKFTLDEQDNYLKEPRKYCNTYRKSTKVGNERKFTLDEQDDYLKEPRKYCKNTEEATYIIPNRLNGRHDVEDGEWLTSEESNEIDSEYNEKRDNTLPGQDPIYNQGHELARLNWSPVSSTSSANFNDSFLEHQTLGTETSPDDEMRCILDLKPISFSNEPIITRESLQNLEKEDKDDLAGEIMHILLSTSGNLSIQSLLEALKDKVKITFEENALEDFLHGKFQMETQPGRAAKFVKASTLVRLCRNHKNMLSGKRCNCNTLHVCKFYLLSTCPIINCKFGHDLTTEHNIQVLKRHFLHRVLIRDIKCVVQSPDSRNGTTVPAVCKFYNANKGCMRGDRLDCGGICHHLHICQHYIFGKCKFENHGCKRSHSLSTGQPQRLLDLYGLGHVDHQTLTNLIRKTVNETDETPVTIEGGCHGQAKTDERKMDLPDSNLKPQKGNFVESESFIPLETENTARYFSKLANSCSIKNEITSDHIQDPIYHNADLISTSAREINEKKDEYLENKEMLQEIDIEGTKSDIILEKEIKIKDVSENINISVDIGDNEESKIVADNRNKCDHATIQTTDGPDDTDHTEKVDLMVDTKYRHNAEVEVTMAKTDASMTGDEQQSHKAEETENMSVLHDENEKLKIINGK